MTSGRVGLAVDVGASEISVEGFAARETYTRVVKEALRRYRTPAPDPRHRLVPERLRPGRR